MTNEECVRAYLAAVERFEVEAVAELLADDVRYLERPNRLKPAGASSDRAGMLANLPKGRAILRRQRYEISSILTEGDGVAAEVRWEGVLAIPLGSRKPGETVVAHSAMLFQLRGSRIASQTNFDCYEEF